MEKLRVEGDFKGNAGEVNFNLLLMHFVDENSIHIIYSPHLDLSGYGETKEEAKESFKISIGEFLDYTMKKRTLGKVLSQLGWNFKGTTKKQKKIKVPTLADVIKKNSYVSEIFDKYPVHTFHQNVGLPTAFA